MGYEALRGRLLACVAIGLLVAGFAAPALGAAIPFSLHASEVLYEGKCDPVFEEPVLDSETLLFMPTAFEAVSISAAPSMGLTDGTVILTITALEGSLGSIRFHEGGDYTLAGGLSSPSLAYVSATLAIDVRSVEVNGLKITSVNPDQIVSYSHNASFDPGDAPDHGFWDLTTTIDLAGALAAAGVQGGATKVTLAIDNTLVAMSQTNSAAFIAKKWVEIEVPVPEASVLTLLVAGFCTLLARRRR